jgi:hypothetical protein
VKVENDMIHRMPDLVLLRLKDTGPVKTHGGPGRGVHWVVALNETALVKSTDYVNWFNEGEKYPPHQCTTLIEALETALGVEHRRVTET